MENFRTCPICVEVPGAEIFQCSAGHVICESCVCKVDQGLCPQCRVPLGIPKIRNRALEEILDAQDFECKFKDKGCTHLCKRDGLTNHFDSCSHNPDVILCHQMGLTNCEYRLGSRSKDEVIQHFMNEHNIVARITPDLAIALPWETLLRATNRKRKLSTSMMTAIGIGVIISSDATDTSPLFLAYGKMNQRIGCWSFECIKIWDTGTPPSFKYNAIITFNRYLSSNSSQGQSSSFDSRINDNPPFPFGGIMSVCNIKEAHQLFEASPINMSTLLFEKIRYGSNSLDIMEVEITEVSYDP